MMVMLLRRAATLWASWVVVVATATKYEHFITSREPLATLPTVHPRLVGDDAPETKITLEIDLVTVHKRVVDRDTGAEYTVTWKTRAYNGLLPGPTVYLRKGGRAAFTLINNLEDFQEIGTVNTFHALNSTNLHTHGLHVSPYQDNVLDTIVSPGETRTFPYEIPVDHMPGMYWYHGHKHGSTANNVGGGLAGNLVILEEDGDVPAAVAALETIELHISVMPFDVLLQNALYSSDAPEDIKQLNELVDPEGGAFAGTTNGMYGNAVVNHMTGTKKSPKASSSLATLVLVNGHEQPIVSITAGAWTRIRLAYASPLYWANVHVAPSPNGKCHTQLIAKDGIYIADPPRTFEFAFLIPGGRSDFMIKCDAPGTYDWVATAVLPKTGVVDAAGLADKLNYAQNVLLTFEATAGVGDDDPMVSNEIAPWRPAYSCYVTDLQNAAVDDTKTLDFKGALVDNKQTVKPGAFFINGVAFDGTALAEVDVGSVIEVTLRKVNDHVVHFHTNPFQLISVDNATDYFGYVRAGDWHDSLLWYENDITVRVHIADFDGPMVIHCHILLHEDFGMMTYWNMTHDTHNVSELCESLTVDPAFGVADLAAAPPRGGTPRPTLAPLGLVLVGLAAAGLVARRVGRGPSKRVRRPRWARDDHSARSEASRETSPLLVRL